MRSLIKILILVFVAVGCSSFEKSIKSLELKHQYNAGFYLINPANDKVLVDYRSDRYFTPASNTKVYTLYASQLVLPDSMPAFKYVQSDSTLQIWGLSDPVFLNPLLPQGNTYLFLTNAPKISLSLENFYADRFGPGWAWEDYQYYFAQERTAFPIYGNSVVFDRDSLSNELQIRPSIFRDSIIVQPAEKYAITRSEYTNLFVWDTTACNSCERTRPLHFSNRTLVSLLEDTLKIPVSINTTPIPKEAKTFYSIPTDSVLKVMMQESDNFLAEHLLLSVASQLTDSLSTEVGIKHITNKLNSFLPDSLVWRDGSGLSRYNLVTPRNMVALWDQLYKDMGEERLLNLISVGGKAGTLEHWFGAETPYIYGKTGTLSNVFCLSGFLFTKSGKRLIFSYTNNNYPTSSSVIKKEMELILREIYEKY